MILSISRRTDIPAFYSDWLVNRFQEGVVYVRNPFRQSSVSAIDISEHVDGIVFWSKNPQPLFEKLHYFDHIPYYLQFTLNAYGTDMEPNLPSLEERINSFRQLASFVGPERVVWRYDPILISPTYNESFHTQEFAKLAKSLEGSTHTCMISFVDMYRHITKQMKNQKAAAPNEQTARPLATALQETAAAFNIAVKSCAEPYDLGGEGISRGSCIDAKLIGSIGRMELDAPRDRGQRRYCGCAKSVDIGMYNTCKHGCLYCYANRSCGAPHDPDSPLLAGKMSEKDNVTPRKLRSSAAAQSLFTGFSV